MPVDTFFVDSSELAGPLMNSASRSGAPFGKNLTFLGRAGVKTIAGLRVAYISGLDSDVMGSEVWASDPSEKYLAHYFVKKDIQTVITQYLALVAETKRAGVDIFLCG